MREREEAFVFSKSSYFKIYYFQTTQEDLRGEKEKKKNRRKKILDLKSTLLVMSLLISPFRFQISIKETLKLKTDIIYEIKSVCY
jgi:hypothetical protein